MTGFLIKLRRKVQKIEQLTKTTKKPTKTAVSSPASQRGRTRNCQTNGSIVNGRRLSSSFVPFLKSRSRSPATVASLKLLASMTATFQSGIASLERFS